jgi:hypothetical protein
MEAIRRLLDDTELSESKRRKIEVEIQEAFENNPSDPPLGLIQFLSVTDLTSFAFVDLWNLLQAFPSLFPVIWTDENFRKRMDFEFNDVYRNSVVPTTQTMKRYLQEELVRISTKSSSGFYPEDSIVPWALLYQRCKRMMLLSKTLDGKRLNLYLQNLPTLNRVADLLESESESGLSAIYSLASTNGPYIATPCVRPNTNSIREFVITNWASKTRVPPVLLDVREFNIVNSSIPDGVAQNFAVTNTGKLVYLLNAKLSVGRPYLEVYDSVLSTRLPAADLVMIERAKTFCEDFLKLKWNELLTIQAIPSSSVIKMTMPHGMQRHIDIDTYFEYLQGARKTVKFSLGNWDTFLQNGWEFESNWDFGATNEKEQNFWILQKDGKAAPGVMPVYIETVELVRGPFFSVSRKQPLDIFLSQQRIPFHLSVGQWKNPIPEGPDNDAIVQSSMFMVELDISKLRVRHPAGFTVTIRLRDVEPYRALITLVAMVGSMLLLRSGPGQGYAPGDNGHFIVLDLEKFFLKGLPDFPKLIRAPCQNCSLPSVANCGNIVCKMPYCGTKCQKADWEKHRSVCKD